MADLGLLIFKKSSKLDHYRKTKEPVVAEFTLQTMTSSKLDHYRKTKESVVAEFTLQIMTSSKLDYYIWVIQKWFGRQDLLSRLFAETPFYQKK